MGTKMKGLLKGFRYISQIFEDKKETEMKIGDPTDVKHVAHIGWDGPSVHSPDWMSTFKPPAFSSEPLSLGGGGGGDRHVKKNEVKWVSEDSSQRGMRALDSPNRDTMDSPSSSRRQSPKREKTEKQKKSRRQQTKGVSSNSTKQLQDPNLHVECDSPSNNLSIIPKKSRPKKSKDISSGESSRSSRTRRTNTNTNNISSTYEAPFSDPGPGPRSGPHFTNNVNHQSTSLQVFE